MAGVGRRGKPNALKRLEGNRGHRPIPSEVRPTEGALLPPSSMDQLQRSIFQRTVAAMRCGVYAPSDAAIIALHSIAQSYVQRSVESINAQGLVILGSDGKPVRNPHVAILARMADIVRATAVELGLTPVARNQLAMPKDASDDPLEVLLALAPPCSE